MCVCVLNYFNAISLYDLHCAKLGLSTNTGFADAVVINVDRINIEIVIRFIRVLRRLLVVDGGFTGDVLGTLLSF